MKYEPSFDFDKDKVIEALNVFLADTYLLYIKTQNYHWNVKGPNFAPLHGAFEDQYKELRDAVDLIAERIRALGGYAVGSCVNFTNLSSIEETTSQLSWEKMVADAMRDNAALAKHARNFAKKLEQMGDQATAHMILERANVHEKVAWMLRATLA